MKFSEYTEIAISAAKRAGEIQKKYFNTDFEIKSKRDSYDRVTVADVESEKIIVDTIMNTYPEHNILAEEGQYETKESPFWWIVDPLDGTNNFSCGIPIFASSIACVEDGIVISAVIYNPITNEMFVAEKDKGAFLNLKPIGVNSANSFRESLLITGFYYDRGPDMEKNLTKVRDFFKSNIIGIRRFGAAALDLCSVASGRAAGFWEFKLSPWDFAAGKLLVEEAGGMVTDNFGKDIDLMKPSYILSSNGKIHRSMMDVLK